MHLDSFLQACKIFWPTFIFTEFSECNKTLTCTDNLRSPLIVAAKCTHTKLCYINAITRTNRKKWFSLNTIVRTNCRKWCLNTITGTNCHKLCLNTTILKLYYRDLAVQKPFTWGIWSGACTRHCDSLSSGLEQVPGTVIPSYRALWFPAIYYFDEAAIAMTFLN